MIIHTLETMAWQLQTCVSQEKYLIGSRTSLSLDGVEQIFVPKIHQEMYHKYEPALSDSQHNLCTIEMKYLRVQFRKIKTSAVHLQRITITGPNVLMFLRKNRIKQ